MSEQTDKQPEYDLKSVKLPYLSGLVLRFFAFLVESPLRFLITPILLRNAGLTWLRKQRFDEKPTLYPVTFVDIKGTPAEDSLIKEMPYQSAVSDTGFHFNTIQDYNGAYQEGKIEPLEVADRLLEAIDSSDNAVKPLRAFIAIDREDFLRQAEAATKRIKNGEKLSVFDGVPVAVKDELDMLPYPTTAGTSFLGTSIPNEDSTVVARMRAAGAILIGKTNMHELGLGITGFNYHYGPPRNPYNPDHYTGGSSSGSAASVAAGFCPVAIGVDGGGSIRIPSSFCGLVGLKPTFKRVSSFGDAPLGWSVSHIGPIAATVTDAALGYIVMAGPDPNDPMSLYQPQPFLKGWDNLELSDLKIGIYWPWFRHADADTVSACETLLNEIANMGAGIEEIIVPELEAGRVAHIVTIAAEMAQALDRYHTEHRSDYGLDTRINLAIAREFTSSDYIQSQRVRTRMMANFSNILEQVDVIITPTTGLPAPRIPENTLPYGESDLTTLFEIMRFVTYANFTGLPAISFPAGYNRDGLPVGMQIIGRPWQEHTLLRLALAAEQVVKRKAPQIYYDILRS